MVGKRGAVYGFISPVIFGNWRIYFCLHQNMNVEPPVASLVFFGIARGQGSTELSWHSLCSCTGLAFDNWVLWFSAEGRLV